MLSAVDGSASEKYAVLLAGPTGVFGQQLVLAGSTRAQNNIINAAANILNITYNGCMCLITSYVGANC